MAICPFLEESMWSGNKCQASGNGNGAPVQDRYFNYCGTKMFSDDYHDCPLYKDATGKRDSGGCYLTSACMSVKGDGFQDNCYELELLRDEYYGAAEPPVRCGESHLSGLTEPPHFVY